MSIYEVLGRNAAAVALRFSSQTNCTEKGTFELPIDLYDDKQLSSLISKDTELEIDYDVTEVKNLKDTYDINFDLRLKKKESNYSSISLIFKFHGFNNENFIMVPSNYYGSIKGVDDSGSLCNNKSSRGKVLGVRNCLAPGMGFYDSTKKIAFFINFKEDSLKGSEQIGFRENLDNKVCEFFIDIPLNSDGNTLGEGNIKINLRTVFSPCKDLGTFYDVYFSTVEGLYKKTKLYDKASMSYRAENSIDNTQSEDRPVNMLESSVKTLKSILMGDREVLANCYDELEKLITKVLLKDISLEREGDLGKAQSIYRIEDLETSYFISKSLMYLYHEDERLIKENWNNTFSDFGVKLLLFADYEVIPYLGKKFEADFNSNMFCISIGIFPAVLAYWGHFLKNGSMISKAEEVAEMLYRITFECKRFYKGIFNIEWSYMLTESYVSLYESTGKKKWLDRAMMSVSFLSTFNDEFKQGIPDEFSGNALFRLFLYTMDLRYIKLLRKILYFPRENSCKLKLGQLTYLEVPGLYINPSEGMIAAVDNIDAKILDRRNDKLRVVITNQTDYPARIRTLADKNTSFNNSEYGFYLPPLGEIYLGPGDTRVLSF